MKTKITPRANHFTTRIFYAALAGSFFLVVPVSSFAKKGRTEEPRGPVEVPAPLSYKVTWFDAEDLGFAGPLANIRLYDVNRYGEAAGWVKRPDGVNIAVLASAADESIKDLNEIFAPELSRFYPGWRLNSARQINAAGQIGMTMVPDEYPTASQSPTDRIVVGDLETGVIQVLGTFENAYPNDLTELGDVSVGGQIQGEAAWRQWIYSPQVTHYAEVEVASDALNALDLTSISRFYNDAGGSADEVYLNNSLVLAFAAVANETRSSDPFCFDLQNDPVPRNVGDGRRRKPDYVLDIAEDDTIYGRIDGQGARLRTGGDWEPFLRIIRASRDKTDHSALAGNLDGVTPALVHLDSLGGFFKVVVTNGDVDRYDDQLSLGLRHFSISQRAELIDDLTVSRDHGFICGESEAGGGGFILTPLAQP
jgi:hypothetical protein